MQETHAFLDSIQHRRKLEVFNQLHTCMLQVTPPLKVLLWFLGREWCFFLSRTSSIEYSWVLVTSKRLLTRGLFTRLPKISLQEMLSAWARVSSTVTLICLSIYSGEYCTIVLIVVTWETMYLCLMSAASELPTEERTKVRLSDNMSFILSDEIHEPWRTPPPNEPV